MPEFSISDFFNKTLVDVGQFFLHVVYAVLIIVVGFRLIRLLSRRMAQGRLAARLNPGVSGFLSNTLTLLMRVGVLVAAALVVGVPGSAFITLFGSAGVAIGLALQGSLSNMAGGLMLLFFHPFVVGDYIKTGENEGTVTQISAFYTSIQTIDNKRIVLPNGSLTNSTLVNFSAEPTRMLDLSFSVGYDSDPAQVRRILLEQATANPMVLPDPAPIAPMTRHGDSALVFNLRAWVARENYKPAEYALLESVKVAFDREGISIPYPQLDVHVDRH